MQYLHQDREEQHAAAEDDQGVVSDPMLDIMMGEISGIRFAKMLKADVSTADIPIIFCTARDSEDDMVKGLNLGADDYITKPYTIRNVIA